MKYQFSMILLIMICWYADMPSFTFLRNTLTAQEVCVSTTMLSFVKSKKEHERTSSKCCFTSHSNSVNWACVASKAAPRGGAGDPSRRLKTGKGTHQVLNSFIAFKVSNFDCIWYEVSVQYDSIDNDMPICLALLSLETLSPHKKFAFPPPCCPLSSPRKNMKEPLRSAALQATQAESTELV